VGCQQFGASWFSHVGPRRNKVVSPANQSRGLHRLTPLAATETLTIDRQQDPSRGDQSANFDVSRIVTIGLREASAKTIFIENLVQ
jgi:hypothetical protein